MAKIDESELGDDFNYILRLADTDVDGLTPIGMGLTSVRGVGARTALAICDIADVEKSKMGGHLTDAEQERIRKAIEDYPTKVPLWMLNRQRDLETGDELHLFSMDVKMTQEEAHRGSKVAPDDPKRDPRRAQEGAKTSCLTRSVP